MGIQTGTLQQWLRLEADPLLTSALEMTAQCRSSILAIAQSLGGRAEGSVSWRCQWPAFSVEAGSPMGTPWSCSSRASMSAP